MNRLLGKFPNQNERVHQIGILILLRYELLYERNAYRYKSVRRSDNIIY